MSHTLCFRIHSSQSTLKAGYFLAQCGNVELGTKQPTANSTRTQDSSLDSHLFYTAAFNERSFQTLFHNTVCYLNSGPFILGTSLTVSFTSRVVVDNNTLDWEADWPE